MGVPVTHGATALYLDGIFDPLNSIFVCIILYFTMYLPVFYYIYLLVLYSIVDLLNSR